MIFTSGFDLLQARQLDALHEAFVRAPGLQERSTTNQSLAAQYEFKSLAAKYGFE